MPKLQLRILTSDMIKVDEPVDMVIMRVITDDLGRRSAVGDMGILPGHMPCSAVLGISALRIFEEGGERRIAVYGGVMNVKDNIVTILTERAEWPEEIDRAQAEASRQEAERRLSQDNDAELRSNQINLRRALVQIEVSSYPILSRK